ncbi:unnamed protein product [Linum trigynum]|uniref:Uncharacterized protein n=1 Tax=Linum trigynum TaxID=586398 RepID=A0AAV2E597_9ROSI
MNFSIKSVREVMERGAWLLSHICSHPRKGKGENQLEFILWYSIHLDPICELKEVVDMISWCFMVKSKDLDVVLNLQDPTCLDLKIVSCNGGCQMLGRISSTPGVK